MVTFIGCMLLLPMNTSARFLGSFSGSVVFNCLCTVGTAPGQDKLQDMAGWQIPWMDHLDFIWALELLEDCWISWVKHCSKHFSKHIEAEVIKHHQTSKHAASFWYPRWPSSSWGADPHSLVDAWRPEKKNMGVRARCRCLYVRWC